LVFLFVMGAPFSICERNHPGRQLQIEVADNFSRDELQND